jgi:signal transduction histidine kinase
MFVVAALGLTLMLAMVLALLAQASAAYHRNTAEGVLRDYAAFAAEQYAGRAQQRLAYAVYPALNLLTQAGTGRPNGRLPDSASLTASADQQARTSLGSASVVFRIPLAGGSLALTGRDTGATLRRWVADTLRIDALRVYGRDWYLALVWGGGAQENVVLAYTVSRDSAGRPAVAYGIMVQADTLSRLLREVGTRAPLLPASLTGGVVVDSVAAVRVVSATGAELYASEPRYPSRFRGSKMLDPFLGGLTVEVMLRPSVAGRLVIGGLPRSRLPIVLGLLGITAILVTTAILQLRREDELARLRSDFVASVSHELRTPLAQIRMFTETLLLGRVRSEGERDRSLEILDQEVRRLTHLVDNLLYVARGERDGLRLHPEDTDFGALAREVAEGFAPLAAARRVTLAQRIEEGVRVRVDRSAMRQVLLNLLDNAVKYGPPGAEVTVAVEASERVARLSVEDRGPGVPLGERERIWERFARLDRDVESAIAGSGIGLAIVRELVTSNGGRCRVEGAEGGGARFVVELPA